MSNTVRICSKCGQPVPEDAPQGLCPKCLLLGAATQSDPTVAAMANEETPPIERVAAAFPQLQILELIGRGGMGIVFKARQPHLDRLVALKLLPEKLARDPQFAERFNREGKFLARLNHPNIVSVYDFGRTNEFYFLIMEYVDGVNLRQAMQSGRFSPAEALSIVPKICEALQYAHEQGVLHRDIKPENILLDTRGRVKIADFGIAKLLGEEKAPTGLTLTGAALGTPHYMAPEQLEKPGTVDHRADIYSLGVVFYEMLTGELPLGRFAAPSEKTPVDPRVDEVVLRSLERERERRFQSIGEVRTRVEGIRQSPQPNEAGGATTPPPREGSTARSHGDRGSGLSIKAVIGAASTGVGILIISLPLALAFLGGGGLGMAEFLLILLTGGASLLAGTILGFLSMLDIRRSGGQIEGRPLAVFATVAFPVFVVLALVMALCLQLASLGSRVGFAGTLLVYLTIILISTGVVTLVIRGLRRVYFWAGASPVGQTRLWPSIAIGTLVYLLLFGVFGSMLITGRTHVIEAGHQGIPGSELHADGNVVTALAPSPSSVALEAGLPPSVHFHFTGVDVRKENNQTRVALEYFREGDGADITFETRGKFPDSTVDFREDSYTGPDNMTHHTATLMLPASLGPAVFEQVLQQLRQKWLDRHLIVQPGDRHTLISVPAGDGGTVEVAVIGKANKPR